MERPQSPSEFVENHHAVVDLKVFSKRLIEVHENFAYWKRQHTCAICDQPTDEPLVQMQFNQVCAKHKAHAMAYQITNIRVSLGYPEYQNLYE